MAKENGMKVQGPLYDPWCLWLSLKNCGSPGDARRIVKAWVNRGAGSTYLIAALAAFMRTYPRARSLRWALEYFDPAERARVAEFIQSSADMQKATEDEAAAFLCAEVFGLVLRKDLTAHERMEEYRAFGWKLAPATPFTVRVLATFMFGMRLCGFRFGSTEVGEGLQVTVGVQQVIALVLKRFCEHSGIDAMLKAALELCPATHDPTRWYWLVMPLEAVVRAHGEAQPAVRILQYYLREAAADPSGKNNALRILQGGTIQLRNGHYVQGLELDLPIRFMHEMFLALGALVERLIENICSLSERHTYLRWLLISSRDVEGMLTTAVLIPELRPKDTVYPQDCRDAVEEMVEQLYGKHYWKTLCSIWDKFPLEKGTPEETAFRAAQATSHPEHHNPDIAEPLERTVEEFGYEAHSLRQQVEWFLNLLSGDVVRVKTTTHLQKAWMPVRRRKDELFGSRVEVIELCQHHSAPERGPACRFRFRMDGMPEALQGEIDLEGNLTLENVLVINAESQAAVQAAVLEALVSVLVPHFVPGHPPHGNGDGPAVLPIELYARRPVIHEEGVVGGSVPPPAPPGIGRVHPTIARWLCEWLLGEKDDIEFDLFYEEGKSRRRYRKLPNGKAELLSGRCSLSMAYMRTIRAYTSPAGAKIEDDQVVPRKPSEWSVENYARYREEGGRTLDFSPVTKTYVVAGSGRRVVLEVPRTFNQGTFASLADALTKVADPSLVARVIARFRR